MISVVIPTIDGREEWLDRCLKAYAATSPADTQYVIVRNEPSCGHAWVKGAAQARGDYVHFTADDLEPFENWWVEPLRELRRGRVPAANVRAADGTRLWCDSPLGDLGIYPNVLVPTLSRSLLDADDWLLPVHYGSDDWVAYVARARGLEIRRCAGYRFTHHVAQEGRNYLRRHADVLALVEAMSARGYVPPVYAQLERNLRTSKTGLDSVRINELDRAERARMRKQARAR